MSGRGRGAARPIRVAIVGGGCAGIAAAFELTRPEHQGRFAVTVYQQGWRLGGKGASGRGANGRIEEHGLHVWMGFYENAFRLLRECYAELGRDPETQPLARWRDAFFPAPLIGLTEERADGGWDDWTALFPPMPGLPGDPLARQNPFSVSSYLVHAARLLGTVIESARRRQGGAGTGTGVPRLSTLAPEAILDGLARLVRYGHLATLVGLAEAMRGLGVLFGAWSRHPPGRGAEAAFLRPLENVTRSATRLLSELARGDDELRRVWGIADLLLTVIRGTLRFGLITDPRGFDAIDDYDFREWLRLNGASRDTLGSAFLRGVGYDRMFAYEDGDPERPRMSAGQALRDLLRLLFTYRGALFWKMRAGMGDAVFAPFHEVLRRRGVRFEFFHRLEALRLAPRDQLRPGERPWVESLELAVQAATVESRPYEPLIDVEGLPCWPARPLYGQLADGGQLAAEGWNPESFWDRREVERKTLWVGEDFDFVVLAVGLGAIPTVAAELVERDRRWRRLVENVKTIETGAFQLWLKKGVAELGWPGSEEITLTGFVKPYDTWADMTHLLPGESWPPERAPRSLAYFCGPLRSGPELPDRGDLEYPAVRRRAARQEAVDFLDYHAGHLWPRAARPGGGFRWDLLVPSGAERPSGCERFDTQYWTANVNPSDRYTLTLPGTAKDRISPLDNTYDNLTVAGDWTACGLIVGCVEAAVMSGRLAAHALSGWPRLEDIAGFDHP
ncbi:MAG TPA: FAD-dependent oxidoreductase [Thermoanaerobaculia bacterium]|nr:FAD-dependent oxidoreductase [Thermoanaerobaculia bacterium]